MPIAIGLLVLAIVFLVFGSKTEDAVIIYYDPPTAEAPVKGERIVVAGDTEDTAEEFADVPADAPAEMDAQSTAQSIYDSVTL